jgi:pimeloyl-ACP methyl ester carboxylesterase
MRSLVPHPRFMLAALASGPALEEPGVRRRVVMARARATGGGNEDSTEVWRIARLCEDRNADRSGSRRQLGALLSAGDRRAEFARITAPTTVIHGTADHYVRPSAARTIAAWIPGARLHMVEGLAHNLPTQFRPRVVDLIATNAGV